MERELVPSTPITFPHKFKDKDVIYVRWFNPKERDSTPSAVILLFPRFKDKEVRFYWWEN